MAVIACEGGRFPVEMCIRDRGRKRQAGDVGHILFFVAVIPAFAEDVDPEEGEHGEAQPVVPGRNIPDGNSFKP